MRSDKSVLQKGKLLLKIQTESEIRDMQLAAITIIKKTYYITIKLKESKEYF